MLMYFILPIILFYAILLIFHAILFQRLHRLYVLSLIFYLSTHYLPLIKTIKIPPMLIQGPMPLMYEPIPKLILTIYFITIRRFSDSYNNNLIFVLILQKFFTIYICIIIKFNLIRNFNYL